MSRGVAITSTADTCAYCGAPATTEDHIPPQALLVGVPRSARPSVRSCAACNNGASDDDEYFRDVVLKYHRVSEQPAAAPAIAKMIRAIALPAKAKYAAATLRSFEDIRVVTPAGIDLGIRPAYRVNEGRIAKAAERYVRGLHRSELGVCVPAEHTVRIQANPESILQEQARLVRVFASGTTRTVQPGVFWYKWVVPADRPSASAWLLVFYDALPLLGLVHPPGSPAPPAV